MRQRGQEMSFQVGKSGLTEGIIQSMKLAFKKHKVLRISVLKNAARNKEKVGQIAEDIVSRLEGDYQYRIIGFTIVMRKLKKGEQ